MPDPSQDTARLLEATLRIPLAAGFQNEVANDTLRLLCQQDEIPKDKDLIKLPTIILEASVKEWFLSIKVEGRYAQMCELKVHCRVAGNHPLSAAQAENLAKRARDFIEAATGLAGWVHLRLESTGKEEGFDHGARVCTIVYQVSALPQA